MSTTARRILVVDDDELLLEFYSRVLQGLGCEPVTATNGDEAMRALRTARERFALVILDLLMPVRTGWELLDCLHEGAAWRDTPVLVITGASMSSEDLERVRAGCSEVMLKGQFDLTRFCGTVNRLAPPSVPTA